MPITGPAPSNCPGRMPVPRRIGTCLRRIIWRSAPGGSSQFTLESLNAETCFKNGKDHCYWSLVEKVPGPHGQWVQRPILYLGEINDSQKAAWIKSTEVFDADRQAFTQLALFPLQRSIPAHVTDAVQVRLSEFTLHPP